MRAVAQRGNSYLVEVGDHAGVVVDVRRKTVSDPFNVDSILARGYWTDPGDGADEALSLAGDGAKRVAHVRPYLREGHPVQGYERHEDGPEPGGVVEHLPHDHPLLDIEPSISRSEEDVISEVLKTWHGFKFGNLAIRVNDIHDDYVSATIRDVTTGENVGSIQRSFGDDGAERYVEHLNLHVNPEYQGAGFASAFYRESEAMYRRLDVAQIDIGATSVGGYAWARMGFEFDGPGDLLDVLEQRQDRLQALVGSGRVSRRLAAEFKARRPPGLTDMTDLDEIPDGYFRSEADIASFGADKPWVEDGREMWLGKYMLLNTAWSGHKRLKPRRRGKSINLGDLAKRYDTWVAAKIRDGGDTMAGYGPDGNVWFDDDASFWQPE